MPLTFIHIFYIIRKTLIKLSTKVKLSIFFLILSILEYGVESKVYLGLYQSVASVA